MSIFGKMCGAETADRDTDHIKRMESEHKPMCKRITYKYIHVRQIGHIYRYYILHICEYHCCVIYCPRGVKVAYNIKIMVVSLDLYKNVSV